MTELTNRQILDAMREALEETARKLANGELDRTGTLSVARPSPRPTNVATTAATQKSPSTENGAS